MGKSSRVVYFISRFAIRFIRGSESQRFLVSIRARIAFYTRRCATHSLAFVSFMRASHCVDISAFKCDCLNINYRASIGMRGVRVTRYCARVFARNTFPRGQISILVNLRSYTYRFFILIIEGPRDTHVESSFFFVPLKCKHRK